MKVDEFISTANAGWSFSGETASNFDQHVQKSVPLYIEGHALILELSDFFILNEGNCYDLGCSTGALLKKIAERNSHKNSNYIGVDKEEDMASIASKNCLEIEKINIINKDVLNVDIQNADLVICYYTMQFVNPKVRQLVFNKIYNGLNWGGAFILFEKVRASDARFQDISSILYTEFKLKQGYTPSEIIAKAKSLKGVLEPFSTQGNIDLMNRAGFIDISTIMKYICFEGFLAIK